MRLVVLGSEQTVLCFALAGVDGVVVRDGAELATLLQKLTSDPDVGAVMVEREVAAMARDLVEHAKRGKQLPLVVELPGEEEEGLEEMLRRTVGL